METEIHRQISGGTKSPIMIAVIIIVIIAIVAGFYILNIRGVNNDESLKDQNDAVTEINEPKTLSSQVSETITENLVKDIPKTNPFDKKTNPFDTYKNPFESR